MGADNATRPLGRRLRYQLARVAADASTHASRSGADRPQGAIVRPYGCPRDWLYRRTTHAREAIELAIAQISSWVASWPPETTTTPYRRGRYCCSKL